MQYRVNLAQADVINMNNRLYSKECLEQIKDQINKKSVVVGDELSENKMTVNKQIGKTIKAEFVDGCLYVDVVLFRPISSKFINLSLNGRLERSDTEENLWIGGKAKGVISMDENGIQYDISHQQIKDPEISFLFAGNTSSFSKDNFKTSNFVKKQIIFNNE